MARPKVVPFGAAENLIAEYSAAGGVVHYVCLDATDHDDPHRAAAVGTIGEVLRRHRMHLASLDREPLTLRYVRPKRIWVEAEKATGHAIGVRKFAGPAYDLTTDRILADRIGDEDDGCTNGYADAFKNPPYGMQVELAQLTTWFNSINDQLFGGLHDQLDVWSWNTDWSSWFDPGHEWWGSFLWTVRPTGSSRMVGIAASATD